MVSFNYLPIHRSTQFTHATAHAYADYRSNEHLSGWSEVKATDLNM